MKKARPHWPRTAPTTLKNVSEATSVNYGVLATGDFAAANGNQWSNYALPGTALTGAGSITPRALTVSLQGTVEKMVDGNTKATLAPRKLRHYQCC